jgi:hypothetical protein
MKYIILTALLAVTATPRFKNSDPYKKYDLVIDHAQQTIEVTRASIDEAKAMTETKVQQVQESVLKAEQMAKKVELLERVCEVYEVPVPASLEDFEQLRIDDSIRFANMQQINKR